MSHAERTPDGGPRADEPLHVAMVCPYSLSRPGGVQGQVRGLARALGRAGHQVTVLAPDDRHRVGALFEESGEAAVFSVGHSIGVGANGSVAPVALSPRAAYRAGHYVRTHGFDVAHLHEPLAPLVGFGLLVGRRVPMVATYHRSGVSPGYRALGLAARPLTNRIGAHCVVSEAARVTASSVVPRDYQILFNGIDLERFAAPGAPRASEPTILFLGRHEERKGLGVLLGAFERLSGPARLWVAGDGPQTASLRGRYGHLDNVSWLGLIPDDEVATRVREAHVLCAPSLGAESFGVVLLEAMAGGAVVVASDVDGYRAAAGGHALLTVPGDAPELAGALAQALADATSGTGLGSRLALASAYEHARAWSIDALAERYVAIYRRVTGEFAKGRQSRITA